MDLDKTTVKRLLELRYDMELKEQAHWQKTIREIESWRHFYAVIPNCRHQYQQFLTDKLRGMEPRELNAFVRHYRDEAQSEVFDQRELASAITYAQTRLIRS